jgi:hypothetical protein
MAWNKSPNPTTTRSATSECLYGSRAPACLGHSAWRALFLTTIIAAVVGGCASHGHHSAEERVQKYPENYKTELLDFLHSYINDPTKIRDAAITDPVLMPMSAIVESGGAADSGAGGRGGGGRGGGSFLGQSGGNPFDDSNSKRERFVVCVRYNAKDRPA